MLHPQVHTKQFDIGPANTFPSLSVPLLVTPLPLSSRVPLKAARGSWGALSGVEPQRKSN